VVKHRQPYGRTEIVEVNSLPAGVGKVGGTRCGVTGWRTKRRS